MARTGKKRGKARSRLRPVNSVVRGIFMPVVRACRVDRTARRRARRRGAGGGHRLLPRPDPRSRRTAGPARRRLGDPGRHLGQDLRLARPAARPDHRRRRVAAPDQRDHRHRGPPLLLAPRHRPARHRPGARDQPARRRHRAGRLLDHPAGREADLVRQQPHHRAQDQGDPGGAGAGVEVLQEPDPLDLPQPRLPRRQRHRLRGRLRALLRQVRGRRHPRRGGDARGPPARAVALRADQRPRPRPGARQDHRRADGGPGLPHRRPGPRGPRPSGGALRRRRRPRRRRLRRLGDVLGPRLPHPPHHRGHRGRDHLRPAHPARRRGSARRGLRPEDQAGLQRPGRDRGDVAGRRGARDDRRPRIRRRRGRVQPRHHGPAPDRLALQAVRLCRGAAGRRQPVRSGARRAALALRPRLRRVDAAELLAQLPRPDHPDRGAGELGQHRHRPRLRGDRPGAGARRRLRLRHHHADRRGPGAGARRLRGVAAADDRRLRRLSEPRPAHHALRPHRPAAQVGRRRR